MTSPTASGVVPWPAESADAYRAAGLWEGRSLFDAIAETARARPTEVAVVDGDNRLTYADLIERAEAAARRLRALGIGHDDRVVVQLPNSWHFVVFTLACLRAGVVPVMALPAHREQELRHLAQVSESVAIVVPREHRGFDNETLARTVADDVESVRTVLVLGSGIAADSEPLDALLAPARPAELDAALPGARGADVAVFLLSGGTTGLPKLITRTHDDYLYNVRATSAVTGLGPDSVYLVALPAGHNFPLACPGFLGALIAGGRVVTIPSPEPQKALDTIRAEGVTVTALVPAVVQRWTDSAADAGADLPTLRVVQVGGSRLADELAARVEPVLGARLQQVFGMAEGLINMTRLDDPEEVIRHTQGRPVSDADEIKIVDEGGGTLAAGDTGVLLTRGPYTPRGYYRAPEHNLTSFTPDGWYISGDIVQLRPDGNLVVQGRLKDMINRGGEKISAEEVENLMYRFDQVALAAAVAMPDPLLGERVCVYAVLRDGQALTLEDIQTEMRSAGVAAFKFPERLEVVDSIPLTKVGKIDKKELRVRIADSLQATPPATTPASHLPATEVNR